MSEEPRRKTGIFAVAGVHLAMVALGLWRVLRGEHAAPRLESVAVKPRPSDLAELPARASRGDVPPTEPHLQDLSLDTPGAAPLDRLARTFNEEKREEEQGVDLTDRVPPFMPHSPRALPTAQAVSAVLSFQSLESEHLAGWHRPNPSELPLPTYAPAVMAFGIVIFAMGLATTWYVCVAGAVVFAIAAWRWTGELQGD